MPRTTTLECPGCPPLRALTFDALGLIKGLTYPIQFPCQFKWIRLVFPSLSLPLSLGI
uniref:WD repeat-containing protein DDB_G0290555-like n=1 Tax=Rhizophora mucronata TaxID=61149 RepID=A0A2P2KWU9_RHIMU